MQTAEQNLYIKFTKSVVDSFEEFINNVDKHGQLLSDAALIMRLKQVGKKLQTIFNKWENCENPLKKPEQADVQKMDIAEEVDHGETVKSDLDDEEDDFTQIMASRIGDCSRSERESSLTSEVTSTTIKLESSIVKNDTPPTPHISRKAAELIRKFKLEKVKEEWIMDNDGIFFVEEYSKGSWKCFPCKLDNLSTSNIISHVSGGKHWKKVELFKRESSENRQNSNSGSNADLSNLSALLSDTLPELLKRNNSSDGMPSNGYYCCACRSHVNSEESLKLHLSGGKHRKKCETPPI